MNKTIKRAIRTARANSEWHCLNKNKTIHRAIPIDNSIERSPAKREQQNNSEK